jgi:hypothetical protein
MNLHRYERAPEHEVKDWLKENLKLTDYQREKIHNGLLRESPFYFYQLKKKEKINPLWRLSIIPWVPYVIALFIGLPFTWLFTGHWGYGDKLYNFHGSWRNKLGF